MTDQDNNGAVAVAEPNTSVATDTPVVAETKKPSKGKKSKSKDGTPADSAPVSTEPTTASEPDWSSPITDRPDYDIDHSAAGVEVFQADPSVFKIGPNVRQFDPKRIEHLAMSILEQGQDYPIIVRPDMAVVDGFRRHAAVSYINKEQLTESPLQIKYVIFDGDGDPRKYFLRAVSTAATREDPSVLDVSRQIGVMKGMGMSGKEIAAFYGQSEAWVTVTGNIAKLLPEPIQDHIQSGRLTKTAAYELTKMAKVDGPDAVMKHLEQQFKKEAEHREAERARIAKEKERREQAKKDGVDPSKSESGQADNTRARRSTAAAINRDNVGVATPSRQDKPMTTKETLQFLASIPEAFGDKEMPKEKKPSEKMSEVAKLLTKIITRKISEKGGWTKMKELLPK